MLSLAGIKECAGQVYASAKVENAAAAIVGEQPIIVYNPSFMKDLLERASNNRWSVISVLAHELDYDLNWHTIKKTGSSPDKELEADFESGWIMGTWEPLLKTLCLP